MAAVEHKHNITSREVQRVGCAMVWRHEERGVDGEGAGTELHSAAEASDRITRLRGSEVDGALQSCGGIDLAIDCEDVDDAGHGRGRRQADRVVQIANACKLAAHRETTVRVSSC
jgi:hypothetical protein